MHRELVHIDGLDAAQVAVESDGDQVILSINRRKRGGTTQTVRLDVRHVEEIVAVLVRWMAGEVPS